ncbi:MAG: helix-turn-helix domain-containing protein [Bacteroidetes bacterium]|nr:helix-turn-helix domain-containing protein [Bacteroidota bacterium]
MVSPIDLIYAQRLRALRLKKGFHQKEAAELLGYNNQQQYSELELGHKSFTDEIINLICVKFDITVSEFVNGESNGNFTNSPYANYQSGTNHSAMNDVTLINEVLQTKNKLIEKLEQENEALKKEIERLKKK